MDDEQYIRDIKWAFENELKGRSLSPYLKKVAKELRSMEDARKSTIFDCIARRHRNDGCFVAHACKMLGVKKKVQTELFKPTEVYNNGRNKEDI